MMPGTKSAKPALSGSILPVLLTSTAAPVTPAPLEGKSTPAARQARGLK